MWLTKTVPTSTGWGIFWSQRDANALQVVRIFYAHVDFSGHLTNGPMHVMDVPFLESRGRYYLAAWHNDHFGILFCNSSTLYYFNMSIDGVLSGQQTVGPTLFVSDVYSQEADGDLDSYPDGFLGVIEGVCSGHECAYAFRLGPDGRPISQVYNLVDFDVTHQFWPRSVWDGAGFTVLSVKDIDIDNGGVVTKYMLGTGAPLHRQKVVPTKQYLWDEFPDLAWNGDHQAALWTENSGRDDSAPWQVHFATFRRMPTTSEFIADRVLDVQARKSPWVWAAQVHATGPNWIAQYTRWQPTGSPLAVFQWLDDQGDVLASLTPFPATADALGSSPHFLPDADGQLGVARAATDSGNTSVTFQLLDAPRCTP